MKRSVVFLLFVMLAIDGLAFQGKVILAGGGAEGDQGDTSSWSYHLYKEFVLNGDTNSDGVVKVAILTTSLPNHPSDANWLPNYFQWIGANLGVNVQAANYEVSRRNEANDPADVGGVADSDAVFIKGGDQGEYYDLWNDTLLEAYIHSVVNRGGAVGGTSAGAMSQAYYSFAGGADLISADVLADAQTSYLDDVSDPGSSGIHTDFLGFVDAVVDSHYTERGRLGRLLGIMARAAEDHQDHGLLAIGVERKTGLVITGSTAEVRGVGSVSFIKEGSGATLIRESGKSLFYTNLHLDRLTEGWRYDLATKSPDFNKMPVGVAAISPGVFDVTNTGALTLDGAVESDNSKFAHTGNYYLADYARIAGTGKPYIRESVGFTDCGNSNSRADKHETLFHLLHDAPTDLGVMTFAGGSISRESDSADVISFSGTGAILIDASTATYKGLSPHDSNWATTGGSLRAAALTGLTLHVLADSQTRDVSYNSRTRQLTTYPSGGGPGGGLTEIEPNDSRGDAHDLTGEIYPLILQGTIASSSDRDYFKVSLQSGETMNVALTVPAGVDYDLYFLDKRGRTLIRSVNDGNGLAESLSYTNTGRKSKTYYVEVESYSGSSSSAYTLSLSRQ